MSVVESFHGYVANTTDSLLLYEACRRGLLPRVGRRLQEKERNCLVRSGSVFVFDEKESGIKRWTDGLVWSPSRILGNFLIYRELDRRASQGGKRIIEAKEQEKEDTRNEYDDAEKMRERALVGSLTNSYKFKKGGLIKKSMSIVVDGVHQNLISYYDLEDVMAGRLRTPSNVPELAILEISPDFLHKQNFRIPLLIEPGGEIGEQQQDLPSPPPSSSSSTSSERRQSTREPILPPPGSQSNIETEQAFMAPQHRNSLPFYPPQNMAASHDYSDIAGQKRKYSLVEGAMERQARQAERQMSWSPSVYRARTPSIDHMSHSLPTSYGIPMMPQFGRQAPSHMSDSLAEPLPSDSNTTTTSATQLAPIQHSFRPPFGHPIDPLPTSTSLSTTSVSSLIAPTSAPNNLSYAYMHVPDRRIDESPFMPPIGGRSSGGGGSMGLRNNPPNELFSSQSFHAVNHNTIQNRNDTYVATNSFMNEPALVAGNWSEYDLQM
ncbi:hypothetical protein NQZ79_g4779 [Umbelopsis isabellina]|nr:hypothetical protein NQZ79_g4779 [Umbelopsis isabellina]